MSHFNPGLISAYNSLTDKHLSSYFSSTRIRRHLQRAGLITRSGRIVPDKEYKHKILQKVHQKHVRECLAQAIFLKVLEMERLHQMEIKRKLEEFARRERVHKMKVARTKRFEEDVQMMSPHPPVGARAVRKQHSGPVGGHYASSESPCSSRPNTAPGTMQRPARLKPIRSGANKRRSAHKVNQAFSDYTKERESGKHEPTAWDPPPGVSPYCLPVLNNFVTPLPPATKKKNRGPGCNPSGTPSLRGGRRLRPATTFSAVDTNEERSLVRISEPQSKVRVTMVYFGKSVHLSHDSEDPRDEVRVFQQHCGGENLCVYKGKLREGETFQFVSRRHRGFPFSLTFFLNGLQVERLSSCCEFKHRRGPRLGGRHGHFGFSVVERASPCYKCIIAMGLDKKPAPPPMKVQDARGSFKEARSTSHSGRESTPSQQEDKHRHDYDEDFEGDDDIAVEESNEKKAASPTGGTDTQPKDETSSDSEDHNQDDDDTRPRSSCCEESDVEVVAREDEEEPKEILQAETVDEEEEQANPEDSAASESSADVDVLDSGQKEQSQETSGEKSEGQESEDESKLEEPERAKSVQEKLAEAILKESQQSSEPELSDTSTEEEETAAAPSEQGQKPEKDEAVLAEAQLEEASEPKEPAEAGQEEPEDVKEGDSEEKMEEGAEMLEPQDNSSAISVNVDPEVKPGSETTETKAEETAGGSELEATPEDPSGLDTMVSQEDVKDEASGDVQDASEEPDDPVDKCEEDGKKEEEQINPQIDINQESEKEETIEKTGDDETQEAEVATFDEAEAEESEKTETGNCEALKVKSAEDQEVKADEVEETNEEDERENEASADKDEAAGTAQANEGEESNKATNEENEAEDCPDKDEEEKIVEAEESQETNQATTDKEESKPMEKVVNEAEGLEELTNKDDEKMTTLEVKEGQELDKTTTDEEESEAIKKDEREDGAKDDSDKEIIMNEEIDMESEARHKDDTDIGEQKQQSTVEDENKSEDRSVTFDPEERQESAKDSQEQEKPSEANLQNEHLNVVTETLGVFQQSSPTEETIADKVLRTENGKRSQVDGENGETSGRVDLTEEPDQIRQDLDLEKTKQTEKQSSEDPSQNLTSEMRSPGPEANTEEASKASDEGASVLLQPQSNTQTANQVPNGESPDALARASSAELVTNWLSTHQASKFFETFVEPLEDFRDSDAGPGKEARQSSEPLTIVEESSREEVALKHLEGEAQSYPERRPMTDDWGMPKSNLAVTH
ncbi:glutamate-rich protein 3 isoform X2 [Syngnathus acus]|uniref:glutamate-rich protein 3 isoform X2 n=1 Tax=Syngnathus acus TaxID=161584 RepID=UPI001885BE7B|nr:glutamate-rich protein 3 isoform X2 [Syngnathus acus]